MDKSATTILTLDLGTQTGWASRVKTGIIVSGTIDFSNNRFEGGGMRYLRFLKWLDKMDNIKEIYFEEVRRHLGVDASHAYGGFLGVLTSWCENNFIPYEGVPVQTIKKYITGKGNASKQMVIDAVNARGYKVTDHNEADAVALLLCVEGREV